MAKGANQKLKILYLMKILMERTDENHSITMPEIISALEAYGISAERKSIYSDIESLRTYGLDIVGEAEGKTFYYRVVDRTFELAELKLLVDSVQSAKFITEKKSNELIKKIESLSSRYEAQQLQRQVYVQGRIKTINESIYYNVDSLHTAIAQNSRIKFQYCGWYPNKELVPLNEGIFFEVSPWALTWDDEYYYLVAFDHYEEKLKHYRVDKMVNISILEEKRGGKELFEKFDMGSYSNVNFGMFHGDIKRVHISFPNYMVGVFIDRFGKDATIRPEGEDRSEVIVNVAVSKQFFGWIASLGRWVKITGPDDVVEEMKEFTQKLADVYRK